MLATKKQLFALYCITGKDYRESGISKEDASKIIAESQKNNPRTPKALALLEKEVLPLSALSVFTSSWVVTRMCGWNAPSCGTI